MGLCKCEKRKVTNLFCFEHHVNVCDHCAVADHKRCVIKSYLHWLQDSDYNPNCELCKSSLLDESSGECVRLLCYDVFHWDCLNKWAAAMPSNIAPAGFQCPICSSGIFPAANDMSPVAVALRELLETVPWSRAGLGLPILESDKKESDQQLSPRKKSFTESSPSSKPSSTPATPEQRKPSSSSNGTISQSPGADFKMQIDTSGENVLKHTHQSSPGFGDGLRSTHSVGSSDMLDGVRSQDNAYIRKQTANSNDDESSSKYKRKSPMLLLARWLSFGASKALTPRELTLRRRRRTYMLLLLLGLVVVTLIYFGIAYGRSFADTDPLLDPRANPHIRVKDPSKNAAVH